MLAITAVGSIFASSGIWSYMQHRNNKDKAEIRLIRGIGYTTLMNQSTAYIKRGTISYSEYVELTRML